MAMDPNANSLTTLVISYPMRVISWQIFKVISEKTLCVPLGRYKTNVLAFTALLFLSFVFIVTQHGCDYERNPGFHRYWIP